ncbi:uncharacterized protein LOC135709790 [Ochlerotatus camptorhynchus]|uniref:uncharacterized protein LOC135709790 n=1 Tax=Ochlerotatus camptorhynchus TaxID=644619 RepID=UPI0031D23B57
MGCGPSNSAAAVIPLDGDGESTGSKATYPPSEAFEIPLNDENPESLIKKHPPLRLKRLEEHTSNPPSIENLEEKLATAEIRRQQFLASRALKTTTFDKTGDDANGDIDAIQEVEEPEECGAGQDDTDKATKSDEPVAGQEETKLENS